MKKLVAIFLALIMIFAVAGCSKAPVSTGEEKEPAVTKEETTAPEEKLPQDEEDDVQGVIKIGLKYDANRKSVITGLKKISKPGLRVYAKCEELPKVLGGLGIAIISTSKGVMTDKEARKNAVGGEVLCYVW